MYKVMKKALPAIIVLGWFIYAAGSEGSPATSDMTNRMMLLALELGIILFAARLGNLLFEKIRLPGVLGELIAGIFIGPYVLGGAALPGLPQGLFPVYAANFPISPELYGICSIASIVLLFVVGLETDLKLFLRFSVAGLFVGLGGVIFSFVLGAGVAVLFSGLLTATRLHFLSPFSLLLGVVSTATSVGITARILSEKNKMDTAEGVTILAGAVIDDILGILCLTIGLGIIAASSGSGGVEWVQIGLIALKSLVVLFITVTIGALTSQRISLLLKWFRDRTSIAIMAFGLALLVAGLLEEAGLALIIGAYLTGLSLSKTDVSRAIVERLGAVYSLIVPVFFTVMGMLVNPRLLFSWPVLAFGGLYTLSAILAKVIGCGLPTLFLNFNLLGALRVGFGMLPRGEVALIVTSIGLTAGFLTPEAFGIAVMMILITTLIAPPILVNLFRIPHSGLTKALPESHYQQITFDFPSLQVTEMLVTELIELFESEGYFVYHLDQVEPVYQIRKESETISFSQQGTTIVFDCDEKTIALINTAMYEVLAEFEQTLAGLKKPIDTSTILSRQIQVTSETPSTPGLLVNYLSPDDLVPHLRANTKIEAIDELLKVLNRRGVIKNLHRARKAILEREEILSTGIQYGIAIPHGKTDAVSHLVCAIGLKPEGLDFQAIDGLPTRIIVLSLSPKSGTAPHLQFLSAISQTLDESGRQRLLQCQTAAEMWQNLQPAKAS